MKRKASNSLLKSANGGDIVVLSTKSKINHRYTHYLWRLAEVNNIKVNSITTISTKNRSATNNVEVKNILQTAEAIFLTGGDQYRYKSYWENTDFIKILNKKIADKTPIAGSSAGLAILGEFYFSAKMGLYIPRKLSTTQDHQKLSSKKIFLRSHYWKTLLQTLTTQRETARSRLLAFQNKTIQKYGRLPIAIGVDEKTSLVVNEDELYKLGHGDVFIYQKIDQKNLNFGPIKRFRLDSHQKYKSLQDLNGDFEVIEVINGEITIK